MRLVYIVVEDERQVFEGEDFSEALVRYMESIDRVQDMHGDIEASLIVTWKDP